jgi:ATP-dependent 26S proteasome regulatory subunit
MNRLDSSAGILVIGATNRPELLDPALLRGGRLSRTIHLALPEADAREAILRMHTARMPTVDVDLKQLAAATAGWSGADLKALCQQAAVHALVRTRGTDGESAGTAAASAVLPEDLERAVASRTQHA